MAGDTSSKDTEASPWFRNLSDLQKYRAAASKKRAFVRASDDVLRLFRSTNYLHILHIKPEDNPDQLLRLHMFLQVINAQKSFDAGKVIPAAGLIVADSKTANNEGYHQAYWTVTQHTRVAERGVFKGDGYVFENLVLIRGVTEGVDSSNARSRVQLAIKYHVQHMKCSGVIWHEYTTIALLASMVKDVEQWQASFGNAPLKAVTLCPGLSMDRGSLRICSGLSHQAITTPFVAQMRALAVPLISIDTYMLGINSRLESHMQPQANVYCSHAAKLPYFTRIFPLLLPLAAYDPLIKKNMDDLAVNVYRLAAAQNNICNGSVIDEVKKDFTYSKVSWWAKRISDQNQFTTEKCKRSMSTHLMNIAANADAPVNFDLTAFPGTLLDLCRDTSSVLALSCEVDFSGLRLRARTSSDKREPILYVLVSKSTKVAISRLHADWSTLCTTLVPPRKVAKIDRTIARHWLYMVKVLRKQADAMYTSKAFAKLKPEEQRLFEEGLYWAIVNGAMTFIATRSLDTTPFEWWK